ncbi:FIVAR domain-containing protein [Lactobacillus sp. ESL0785]|uniref:FIVAR domain-containing protein n=1 Tax=Lactobacillus sp. ESL0785 TaxID=2983232 RepID=UPI0023F865BC|nr:FIVAR domain-containing protein [Lactobacillus sp. ESL0785]WEV70790.1 FIVAR domain-containing protein [Lactobacillus sp. ESL0785]
MKKRNKIISILAAATMIAPVALVTATQPQVAAAKTQKGTFTIEKDNTVHVYDPSGHLYTSKSNPKLPVQVDYDDLLILNDEPSFKYLGYRTINGERYLNLGHNGYVKLADVNTIDGKNIQQGKLVLGSNARVYNRNGKKTPQVLNSGTFIKYADKIEPISELKDYYCAKYDKVPQTNKAYGVQRFWLPYQPIKGKDYYALGHGKFIKAANVKYINGSQLYTDKTITVTANHDLKVYRGPLNYSNSDDANAFNDTNLTIKKGQKVKVDHALYVTNEDPDYYYRLAGKDEYIDGKGNVSGATTKLETMAYEDLSSTTVGYTTNAQIYTAKGTDMFPGQYIDSINSLPTATVNELVYLWVPSDQKAELFYRLNNQNITLTNNATPTKDTQPIKKHVVNGYLKASDAVYARGQYLSPLNSAQDAEKDKVTATTSDKQALQDLISKSATTQKSDSYRLSNGDLRGNYDAALANAKDIIAANDATLSDVKLATLQLKNAEQALNGKKVVVKNINKLTNSEAYSIIMLASRAFEGKYQEDNVIYDSTKHTLTVMETVDQGNYKFKDIPHVLDIADYATQEK